MLKLFDSKTTDPGLTEEQLVALGKAAFEALKNDKRMIPGLMFQLGTDSSGAREVLEKRYADSLTSVKPFKKRRV